MVIEVAPGDVRHDRSLRERRCQRLEAARRLDFSPGDPQLIDRAWASTAHAFQGRTVDTAIAAMEAKHPNLTMQKSFYVEISRARDRAELVTDNAAELQAVTGERIAVLEGIGVMPRGPARKGSRRREGVKRHPVTSLDRVNAGIGWSGIPVEGQGAGGAGAQQGCRVDLGL